MLTYDFDRDYPNKKILVTCKFSAPLPVIWNAFVNPFSVEKWLVPPSFKIVTHKLDFKEGGYWLYYMLSPEGDKLWSIIHYLKIEKNKYYEMLDAFCDENGMVNTEYPRLNWKHDFSEQDGITTVLISTTFESEEHMKKVIETGFEEGYRAELEQLREILKL